jgi:hypothetical protein
MIWVSRFAAVRHTRPFVRLALTLLGSAALVGTSTASIPAAQTASFGRTANSTDPIIAVLIKPIGGNGSKVVTFRVRQAGPVELTIGAYGNDGNFVVTMSGPSGRELLVNEIGFYAGTVLYPYARPGRYKLAVEADGRWSGRIDRPIPNPRATSLLGRHSFRGDDVLNVRLASAAEPTVTASCRCRGNFAVILRDFRGGSELLVNEIGRYTGQVLAPRLAAGNYLVQVNADGKGSLRFQR